MAVIHAAYKPGVGGRLVALKRMSSSRLTDPAARRLFLREASIVMRIEHPNVVRTYEVGEADGEVFIAMELLEGATLAELQRAFRPRLPLPIALYVITSALRGLHAAHEMRGPDGRPLGLIHQDISPQNIHIAHEGTVRILDFGIARLLAEDASRSDAVRGKACYLSPEQLSLGKITKTADVFAMGIVLHEALTGQPLFPRLSPEAAYSAILSGRIPAPRSICQDIPPEIDDVVRRALSLMPSERFASAKMMRSVLLEAQDLAMIPRVDVDVAGEWVAQVSRLPWGRTDLERDFHTTLADSAETVAELSTLEPRLLERSGRPPAPRQTNAAIGLSVVIALIAAGSFWLGNHVLPPRAGAPLATAAPTMAGSAIVLPTAASSRVPPSSEIGDTSSADAGTTRAGPTSSRAVARPRHDKPRAAPSSPPSPVASPLPSDDPLATQ
jgi:serine/threonine-protein kinase